MYLCFLVLYLSLNLSICLFSMFADLPLKEYFHHAILSIFILGHDTSICLSIRNNPEA
jgi:uncharacterized membrane protein